MDNKVYFTMIQVRNGMDKICEQMGKDGFEPDLVMGINRGGCIPGVYMSHRMHIPHEVLDVRLRDHKAKPDLSNLEKAYAFQKKILIIDDINDSGSTFKFIRENFGGEDRVKTAAIIHNKPSKFDTLDYWCYNINKEENPQWIVFPWEQW
jgi:hypoxanthine phosphoribosyltransferase|tara:strand:- start:9401 stop:9850 length:450 start_codon:yes stop_codon:yes gene_type:complete